MDLSIVIVSFNTCDLLAQCLRSIGGGPSVATDAASFAEVIVVDNASTDGTVARLREPFPWVRWIENRENRGFASANNQAFPHCRGRHILLLNSDTIVAPGALAQLVARLDQTPTLGALGPCLLNSDGSVQPSGFSYPTFLGMVGRLLLGHPCRLVSLSSPDWLTGACLMVRREVIEAVGPLDEGFFFECEDVDWCRRIRGAGWEIGLLPIAHVTHLGGASGIGYRLDALRGQEGRCYYFRKHHGRAAEIGMRAAYCLYHLLGWLKYATRCRLRNDPGDRMKREVHWHGIRQFARDNGRDPRAQSPEPRARIPQWP